MPCREVFGGLSSSKAASLSNIRNFSVRAQKPRASRNCLPGTVSGVEADERRQRISFVNLGCPKNTVDGEVILGDLTKAGYQVADEYEKTDAVIVNTCAFVDDAKKESLQAILEATQLKRDGQIKKVVVTGCLAQRYGSDLADEIPDVDMVVGFQNYSNLSRSLDSLIGGSKTEESSSGRIQVGGATIPFRPEADRHRLTPRHWAYLRIAEGCSHACSFCAIPSWR